MSTKIKLPRSRRRFTQPISTALLPASEARNPPHMWVRRRSPRKSSKLHLSVRNAARSRMQDYKWWSAFCEASVDRPPRRGLLKSQSPPLSLLHPHIRQVLIPRSQQVIPFGHVDDRIVGDNGSVLIYL